MIKETFDINKTFLFDFVSSDTIFKEIGSLDTKKPTNSNHVPTKTVKPNADLFSIFYLMLLMNLHFLQISVCFKIG